MPKQTLIRLSKAAEMLGCSRTTMKAIVEEQRMKKTRLRDGKTSPYYLFESEVKAFQTQRMELAR